MTTTRDFTWKILPTRDAGWTVRTATHLLTAHARDELGIDVRRLARPTQAAVVSATSFAAGAIVPIMVMAAASQSLRIAMTTFVALVALVALGALGARLGGAPQRRAAVRVLVGGALALFISWAIGRLTGGVL